MYNKDWFNNTAKDTVVSITRVVKGIENTITGYYTGSHDNYIVVYTIDENFNIYIISYSNIINAIVYTEKDAVSINVNAIRLFYRNYYLNKNMVNIHQ